MVVDDESSVCFCVFFEVDGSCSSVFSCSGSVASLCFYGSCVGVVVVVDCDSSSASSSSVVLAVVSSVSSVAGYVSCSCDGVGC